jgi:2'-5' RNA ligase
MQRLFVALPLPAALAQALASLQPPAVNGVRLVAASDMHVTLHFLGGAAARAVRLALQAVIAPEFTLSMNRPGHFSLRGGQKILWVGIEPMVQLKELHARVGEALATVGFVPEARPYVPHITLARIAARAPRDLIETFEQQALPEPARSFACRRFALFVSETKTEGVRYRELESYPLPSRPGPGAQ